MTIIASDSAAAPLAKAARVESLDVLRGVAVFGILMMNITAFGLLGEAYANPLADGGATGLNLTAYAIVNVGFEGTMRGIFSLLFGAGIVLMTRRMEQAGAGILAADIHFRRMLWLMLAGFIHWALLLWYGEILFAYACCGMLLFALRKLPVRHHLVIAALLLGATVVMSHVHTLTLTGTEAAASAAKQAEQGGAKLTPEQFEAIGKWDEAVAHFMPTPESAQEQREWHSGTWLDAVQGQFDWSFDFQWTNAVSWWLTDAIPFMLIGMALLNLGVLGGQLSVRSYGLMALGGYAIGLPLGLRELELILASNFSPLGFAAAQETYQFSRLAMVIGHLGLVLLVIRLGLLGRLQRMLSAVGRMALTNHLTQTLICMVLFYDFGIGLGLYGQLERYQLYGVVAAICLVQLIWSPLWLARFRYGPFEWVWRSLTYWKRQPMQLKPAA